MVSLHHQFWQREVFIGGNSLDELFWCGFDGDERDYVGWTSRVTVCFGKAEKILSHDWGRVSMA